MKKRDRFGRVFFMLFVLLQLFGGELADQVTIAVGIIDAGDVREVLVLDVALHREAGLFAGEGEVPLAGHQHLGGIRSVRDDVVALFGLAVLNVLDLLADLDHGFDEAVKLGDGLAFGGFHHQGLVYREGHSGSVEAKVHQTLGNVDGGYANGLVDAVDVENHLVSHVSVIASIQNRVVVLQTFLQVVGVHDGTHGGFLQAFTAQHLDVAIGDGEDLCATERSGRNGTFLLVATAVEQDVRRQIGLQMLGYANWTYARTATAVRNGKGLVEVEVAHVGSDEARAGQTDLGVHVGTVHVDLSTVVVNNFHEGADAVLIDAVGRGIGDHEGSQVVLVLLGFGFGIVEVDVSVFIAFHHYHLHAGHSG